jgi:Flp pilus assembly pilin Flp
MAAHRRRLDRAATVGRTTLPSVSAVSAARRALARRLQSGQSHVEYSLVLIFVAVVAIVVMASLGSSVNTLFRNSVTAIIGA